jgi:paraquat-inducible protein B
MPNEMENITRSVSETLDKVASLPLDAIVEDVRKLLASVNSIAGAPELKETVKNANATMIQAERMMRETGSQIGPLATSLRKTSDSAEAALKQIDTTVASVNGGYGRDSKLRGEISEMLKQVEEMARSFRLLAAYLEQHPDALLRGKSGGPR